MEERGRAREGAGDGGESTFRDASEREVAAAPGPAQADCREGRGGAGPALRHRARLGRLLSRARGGPRAWALSWLDVPGVTDDPSPLPPASPGLVLLVMAQPWSQWLLLLPGDAEMQMETTVPSMPRPGGG